MLHDKCAALPDAIARGQLPALHPVQPSSASSELDRLYRIERPRLERYLRQKVRDPEDVQDLVQESFWRLLRAAPSLHAAPPGAYLWQTVRNLLIDRWRASRSRPVLLPLIADSELATPPQQELQIEAQELEARLKAAFDELPSRTREIFVLHRFDGVSHKIIAHRFGISVAGVEYHMARALARLAGTLE